MGADLPYWKQRHSFKIRKGLGGGGPLLELFEENGAKWWSAEALKFWDQYPNYNGKCAGCSAHDHQRCFNNANPKKYTFEGLAFCGVHYPPKVWEKNNARRDKSRRERIDRSHSWDLNMWKQRREIAIVKAFEEIAKGELNDPAGYAQMILADLEAERPEHPGYGDNE